MLPFHQAVENEFSKVNKLIVSQLHSDVGLVENIGHYIIDAGGKRLRPVVVLLSALANGYQGVDHLKMAAVIEFIHTATLLHDDVVDVASLRRGRQTANAQWGNAPSVLVGDFLYSRAFQMLVEIEHMPIMSVMANATNVISEGEVQQMANAGNPDISEEIYLQVIYRKTAKLFEAAAQVGACLAEKDQDAMITYGKHLGMAFQIADDVLDYQGDIEVTGKNIGSDLAEGKMTLPLIFARDNAEPADADLIRKAIAGKTADNFSAILQVVNTSGGLSYSRQQAAKEVELAKHALVGMPDGEYKDVLLDLAEFSISRVS
ncbi:MAG: octaprenyl diphosphate synthase [Porticoccaceae bacterium]|jgi:octaprenyl-diphosphate synthase|nr:octaprenyl diphosphate synthase [Porticoccaceae bacterium]MBT3798485.1 octaprenyl diphosphate synthase [Porticoccaceae bacterium]MBT4164019.1 octaprenyl diphosphate synthase [Porticoccaceae bacterium]MBT4211412.1 octaprenyl diphosphate synthase [Porticoccaceae bacterium]MBT5004150.1 octaprenyl diphosphate synthase [Porticoccaceae bacterium]